MTLEQFKEEQKMTYEDLARFLGIGGLTHNQTLTDIAKHNEYQCKNDVND